MMNFLVSNLNKPREFSCVDSLQWSTIHTKAKNKFSKKKYLKLEKLLELGILKSTQLVLQVVVFHVLKIVQEAKAFAYTYLELIAVEITFLLWAITSSSAICQFLLAFGLVLGVLVFTLVAGKYLNKLFDNIPVMRECLVDLSNFFIALALFLLMMYFIADGLATVPVVLSFSYSFCLPLVALIFLLIFNEEFKNWLAKVMPFRLAWFGALVLLWGFHPFFPFLQAYTTGRSIGECILELNFSLAVLEWFFFVINLSPLRLFSLAIPGFLPSFNLLAHEPVRLLLIQLIDVVEVSSREEYALCGGNLGVVRALLEDLKPASTGAEVFAYRSQVAAEMKGVPLAKELIEQGFQQKILTHNSKGRVIFNKGLSSFYQGIFKIDVTGEVVPQENVELPVPAIKIPSLINKAKLVNAQLGGFNKVVDFNLRWACRGKISSLTLINVDRRLKTDIFSDLVVGQIRAALVIEESVLHADLLSKLYEDEGLGSFTAPCLVSRVPLINSHTNSFKILEGLFPHWELISVGKTHKGDFQFYDKLVGQEVYVDAKDLFFYPEESTDAASFLRDRAEQYLEKNWDVLHVQALGVAYNEQNADLFKCAFEQAAEKQENAGAIVSANRKILVTFKNGETKIFTRYEAIN